jgi:hypothetical protein
MNPALKNDARPFGGDDLGSSDEHHKRRMKRYLTRRGRIQSNGANQIKPDETHRLLTLLLLVSPIFRRTGIVPGRIPNAPAGFWLGVRKMALRDSLRISH